MGSMRARIGSAAGVVLAASVVIGIVGVGGAPGATAQPPPPPVSPEDLVASVVTADPGPLSGTVELDNGLGLPALPQAPQLGNGTSTARVWSGGGGLGRVALPTPDGERTLVSDGTTRWSYDSTDRTATRAPADRDRAGPGQPPEGGAAGGGPDPRTDPAGAARSLVAELRRTSTVAVDGTGEVAGRPVHQLVLTPAPTERTLLREVRVAVDAEKRLPLELTVLATGSPEPALRLAFTEITFGPQDPALFTFTPPPGTTVTDAPARRGPQGDDERPERPGSAAPRTVGDGWDTVVLAQRPAGASGATGDEAEPPRTPPDGERPPGSPDLTQLGTPVSGPWGAGRLITTAVASAIVTDDGRIAAGAVPEPVLTEALTR